VEERDQAATLARESAAASHARQFVVQKYQLFLPMKTITQLF